ncbi:TlpA family protein disulfide reductase [Paenibacillus sp. GCM10023252]|uniref:TlpA family protein disulfide reductase n=1 Tax=Paenibacillus sp. GCM10023252 TaxID=3252649 RepID=UPI00361B80F5
MNRAVSFLIVAVLLAGLGVYQYMARDSASATTASADFKPKPGSTVAAQQLPGLDEQTYSIGGKQSKLTFVNFWASWCGPCELEAPDLQELHLKYGDRMQLLGLNATSYDKERSAREFVKEHEFTFPILMDREGAMTKKFKVNNFPTSFLIDENGMIRERVNGVITIEEWERLIEKWL